MEVACRKSARPTAQEKKTGYVSLKPPLSPLAQQLVDGVKELGERTKQVYSSLEDFHSSLKELHRNSRSTQKRLERLEKAANRGH